MFLSLTACASLALATMAQAQDKKADPTGTWMWTQAGRNGGPDRTNTLVLKVEGEKLTGTLNQPGRRGGAATETKIDNGKVSGDEISFEITRDFNGNTFTTKYSGKISGDTIKGKVQMPARNGGDAPEPRDWEAKKQK